MTSSDEPDDWAQFADPSKQQLVLLRAPSGSSGAAWRPLAASDCGRERARTLACQLHDAVAYLHDKCDIVHGAIGVDMCVVASDGAASLRLLLRSDTAGSGDELARLVRLAPECAVHADAPVASKAADVYAYGIVLFYLCAGHLPFQRRSRSALLHAITKMSASVAMPLGDELELHAEIRAATRHKPSKRTLARPAEPLAAASNKKSDTAFRSRAANRQSRAVVAASPRKLTASELRRRHAAAPIAALADATDGERAAFEALCGGAAAGAMLAAIVAERAQEGLFRVPGDASDADAYRRDSAAVLARLLAAPQRHAHTLASLFKQLLREHSRALLPAAVDRDARDLLQLAENADGNDDGNDDDDDEQLVVDQLRLLLAAATAQQRLALRHLARAFHALVAAEPQNKMSLPALVTCIGPSLAICPGWIKWSVMRFDKLFTLKTS
jgi:hypothetical protein